MPFVVMAVLIGLITGVIDHLIGAEPNEVSVRAIISQFLTAFVSIIGSAAIAKGAFDTMDGQPVSLGSMLQGWSKGQVLLTALLVSVLTVVGLIALVIPGLIVMFLLWFSSYGVVDQGMSAIDGMKASFNLVKSNVGDMLLLALLSIGVLLLGVVCLVIGVFVAMPVVTCAAAWTWRELGGAKPAH